METGSIIVLAVVWTIIASIAVYSGGWLHYSNNLQVDPSEEINENEEYSAYQVPM